METKLPPHNSILERLGRSSVKALVVTLRRSTSRAANVQSIIRTCPLPCETWDASDGSQLSEATIQELTSGSSNEPKYPFTLRPGEIGCYLSHRRIWQLMVDQSISRLLVLEDDVSFLPNFPETLLHAIEHTPDGSYVQFQVRELKLGHSSLTASTPALVRPNVVPLRTSAQLVTLDAARRLLKFSQVLERPVDAAIQMTWLHGVEVLVSMPRSVIEVSADLGGSTISAAKRKRKSLLQSIHREWKRRLYRRSIATLSAEHSAARENQLTKLSA